MNPEELLLSPYNPDNWEFARDLCQEIMEKYTQAFPVYSLPMPDATDENDWTKQLLHKSTLLHKRRYEQPYCDEWPFPRPGLPMHDNAQAWTHFLEHQKHFYQLKNSYLETGDPSYLLSALLTTHKAGFHPPLWVLDHWLWPGFADFSNHKGKKSLDKCLGLIGNQRSGNLFDQEEREQKSFYYCCQMQNLTSATGLSIAKCSEILSMRPGAPAPSTIATMYKKRRKGLQEEIHAKYLYGKDLNMKLGINDDSDNPFKNADNPLKVLKIYDNAFRAAAESTRPDLTVTLNDYEAFLLKVRDM